MIDLILISNNRVFRQALTIVMSQHLPTCSILAQADSSPDGAPALAREIPIDVAIVDHAGQAENPIEIVARLTGYRPGVAILALVEDAAVHPLAHSDAPGATNVLVLEKSMSLEAILAAVQHLRCTGGAARTAPDRHRRAGGRPSAATRFRLRAPRLSDDRVAVRHSGRSA